MSDLLAQIPQSIDGWTQSAELLRAKGLTFAQNLVAAIVVFVIGRWVARWACALSRRLILRSKVDQTVAIFLSDFVYALVLVFVAVTALGCLGIDTTSFAAVLAAAGLAIGLALQGSLSNLASGILLITFKPFKVGDSIEIGTSAGTVDEVHVFSTFLRTADNVQICIPNSQITQGVIKNYSAKATRRVELLLNCSYDNDLALVKGVVEEMLLADDRVLKDPKPDIAVDGLAEHGFQLAIRPWVKTGDYGNVRGELVERIKARFDEHNFKLAYPSK
jgi:small conductance mechanosensitive channel